MNAGYAHRATATAATPQRLLVAPFHDKIDSDDGVGA